jgi:aspartyl-tRNA(Asn)/glutamyl-tRNA(Gln) amidotransferase subunit B
MRRDHRSKSRTPESDYTADIGIECHIQLKTASKLFCSCSNDSRQEDPNTTVCPVCLGFPGTLPVLNKRAVELAMQAGIALNAGIAEHTKFDRKNYFYPDLPKGYQITQYDQPIIGAGEVEVPLENDSFSVRIVRAHMEEDAGKLVHPESADYSLVDLNRAGTPLLEIVSQPDMHSPAQAKAYARELYYRMLYVGASDVDLYHGNMRFDLNVSVRPSGSDRLGTRTEIKNMNSFRNVERAADYEIGRQIQLLENGQLVTQETRGWDEQKTYLMREKEEAQDYRYFPEPDIPPLELDRAKREQMEQELPPLLTHVRQTLQATGLEQTKIEALINQPRLAMLGLSVLEEITDPASRARIVNWLTSEVVRLLRADNFDWDDFALSVGQLRELSDMTAGDELNSSAAKQVLGEMVTSPRSPRQIAEEKQLIQTSDAGEIESIVDQIIQNNPQAAQDVRDGESKAIGFLTGEVMKASQGQTNPRVVKDLLEQKLNQ